MNTRKTSHADCACTTWQKLQMLQNWGALAMWQNFRTLFMENRVIKIEFWKKEDILLC